MADSFSLDRYMAFLVGKIQLDTGCKIVLSSSWRNHPRGIEMIESLIVPIFSKTCRSWYDKDATRHSLRGEEIQKWLDERPEVTKYAILDDDSDMLPEQMPNFFKTTWQDGLTPEIAMTVTKHLNS